MKRLIERLVGSPDLRSEGLRLTMRGLRKGEQRSLYTGLGLAALAFLRRRKPTKTLLYRGKVREGTAIVVHHRKKGDPEIQVIKPD